MARFVSKSVESMKDWDRLEYENRVMERMRAEKKAIEEEAYRRMGVPTSDIYANSNHPDWRERYEQEKNLGRGGGAFQFEVDQLRLRVQRFSLL